MDAKFEEYWQQIKTLSNEAVEACTQRYGEGQSVMARDTELGDLVADYVAKIFTAFEHTRLSVEQLQKEVAAEELTQEQFLTVLKVAQKGPPPEARKCAAFHALTGSSLTHEVQYTDFPQEELNIKKFLQSVIEGTLGLKRNPKMRGRNKKLDA